MKTQPAPSARTLPAFPEGWTIKKPYLRSPDGVERYTLDSNGRIDRLNVATVLSNYGETVAAACWRSGVDAASTLQGCRDMLREAAKSFRLHGDSGHAAMCELHAKAADSALAILNA